ncbi:MAG: antitoxin Xre/MbcA/ParS toxin-binding domain-containing protein [Pseudomonadota bacterium]
MDKSKTRVSQEGSDRERVATEAIVKAMAHMSLSQSELGRIIGVSNSQMSNFVRGRAHLDEGSKAFDLSLLFLRVFRSLDALVGGSDATGQAWLRNENTALNGVPLELMKSVQGLVATLEYLDQRRAPL